MALYRVTRHVAKLPTDRRFAIIAAAVRAWGAAEGDGVVVDIRQLELLRSSGLLPSHSPPIFPFMQPRQNDWWLINEPGGAIEALQRNGAGGTTEGEQLVATLREHRETHVFDLMRLFPPHGGRDLEDGGYNLLLSLLKLGVGGSVQN
jgi:hypothetical protein